jgi:periplasmic divalent cation tolerance protein
VKKVKKSGIVTILSTAAPEQAPLIAQALVRERLAACVNILPVRSVYRWKSRVFDEKENLLIIKTREEKADAAIAAVKKMHSYDVPEIIVLPVAKGYPPYLDWIARETH